MALRPCWLFCKGESSQRGRPQALAISSCHRRLAIIVVELVLLSSLRYGAEIVGPMLGRPKPVLQFGHKFVALMQGAYTNAMNLWPVVDRCRIDWRPTIWTKRLLPLGAAFSCFDVYFGFT